MNLSYWFGQQHSPVAEKGIMDNKYLETLLGSILPSYLIDSLVMHEISVANNLLSRFWNILLCLLVPRVTKMLENILLLHLLQRMFFAKQKSCFFLKCCGTLLKLTESHHYLNILVLKLWALSQAVFNLATLWILQSGNSWVSVMEKSQPLDL